MKFIKKLLKNSFLALFVLLNLLPNSVIGMGLSSDHPIELDDEGNVIMQTTTQQNPPTTSSTALVTPTANVTLNPNAGLINHGNTCFMNATFQVLTNVKTLTEYLLQLANIQDPIVSAYIELLKELRTPEQNAIAPTKFLSQNLGTLNKNRIQNLINSEVNAGTANDIKAMVNLRKAEMQNVINNLAENEKEQYNLYIKTLSKDKKIYNETKKILDKIKQQTTQNLEKNEQFLGYLNNIKTTKNNIFEEHKNNLIQLYGTDQTAKNMFNTSSQQDAAEFLGEILDKFIEQTNRTQLEKNQANPSFEIKYIDKCTNNEFHISEAPGKFNNILNLDISHDHKTLKDCLSYLLTREEDLEGKFCQNCNKNILHKRITKINQAPDVLIIQLNRFAIEINPETNEIITRKITKPINVPLQLNIKDYLINPNDQMYTLIGFVCHIGETANGGHYISYAKDYINNNWYLYNDAISRAITNINDIETLGYVKTGQLKKDAKTDKSTNVDTGIDTTPYILLYQRQPIQEEQKHLEEMKKLEEARQEQKRKLSQTQEKQRKQEQEEKLRIETQISEANKAQAQPQTIYQRTVTLFKKVFRGRKRGEREETESSLTPPDPSKRLKEAEPAQSKKLDKNN